MKWNDFKKDPPFNKVVSKKVLVLLNDGEIEIARIRRDDIERKYYLERLGCKIDPLVVGWINLDDLLP